MPQAVNPTVNAILAVATRLEFFRNFQARLDAWLMDNPSMTAQYQAAMASIDVQRLKWEAELDAIVEGVVPVSAPSQEEIAQLQIAVKSLTQRVAATSAINDFMDLIAEAATELGA